MHRFRMPGKKLKSRVYANPARAPKFWGGLAFQDTGTFFLSLASARCGRPLIHNPSRHRSLAWQAWLPAPTGLRPRPSNALGLAP